jgi:hypothetical protein
MSSPAFELAPPDLGRWRIGNTGTEGVWHFESGQPGPRVLVTALVHGNELCGAWALCGLLESGLRPRRGSLTLAFCNLAAFDRFDAAAPDASRFVDEDMNRLWALGRLAASESSEGRRARELLPFAAGADLLLDLHSMHEPGPPVALAGLQARNVALAQRLRVPMAVVVDAGHADGVRLRDHGRFGLQDGTPGAAQALLVECGYHGSLAARDVARDMCVRLFADAGLAGADELKERLPGWRSKADGTGTPVLEVRGAVVVQQQVRFTRDWAHLDTVPRAGTVIGDDGGRPILTPFDDCVLVMPSLRQARPGVTVVRFALAR